MNVSISSISNDPTGPLLFSYAFPFQPIPRHSRVGSALLGSLVGCTAEEVWERLQQRLFDDLDPGLQGFISFLGKLPLTRLNILDKEVKVERMEFPKTSSEIFLEDFLSGGSSINSSGEMGFRDLDPDADQIEIDQRSAHYQLEYQMKLEELKRDPPLTDDSGISFWFSFQCGQGPWHLNLYPQKRQKEILNTVPFPWESHPMFRDFLLAFGGMCPSYEAKSSFGEFETLAQPWLVRDQDGDWGNVEAEWEAAMPIFWTAGGNCYVMSRLGRIGFYDHERLGSEAEDCIHPAEFETFPELLAEFQTYCMAPEQHKDSFYY